MNAIPVVITHDQSESQKCNVVIALRLERAAEAIDVSVVYLLKAVREGRIKATHKKAPGKGKGVTLFTISELFRFASTDEGEN